MRLLAMLTDAFITVFGITPPRPEQRRKASLFIGGFLLAVILTAFSILGVGVYLIARH